MNRNKDIKNKKHCKDTHDKTTDNTIFCFIFSKNNRSNNEDNQENSGNTKYNQGKFPSK